MNTTWIEQALSMGGRVGVSEAGNLYVARIDWPYEPDSVFVTRPTIPEAIEALEAALMEDSAQEMIDQGAV
jgi:hypothetical protein